MHVEDSVPGCLSIDGADLRCAIQFCVAEMQLRGSDLDLGSVYFVHKLSRWEPEALNPVGAELILQRICLRGSRGFSKEKRETWKNKSSVSQEGLGCRRRSQEKRGKCAHSKCRTPWALKSQAEELPTSCLNWLSS